MNVRNFLIVASLAVFVIALGVGASSSSSTKNDGYLAQMLESTQQVEEVEQVATSRIKSVDSHVRDIIEQMPANVSFSLVDLENSETVRINNQQKYISASLYKLYVAYYVYDQIDQGKVSLGTAVAEGQTVGSCLELMIIISDNDCGEALGKYFGWTNITNAVQAKGFQDTIVVRSEEPGSEFITSPNDVEAFFIRLYRHKLLSDKSTDAFINLLLNQQINDRLPIVMPSTISVAHKTGNVYDNIHDAGIIFSDNGDYAFVIMSTGWDASAAFGTGYEYFKTIFDTIFANI